MSSRAIRHVDAFTSRALEGNPAAVVDGDGLDGATMQRIALNQHLSETVFLLPAESPQHDARIRIFTPKTELPFAGHPTLAAAHILVSEGRVADRARPLLIETGAGVIPVAVDDTDAGRRYTMTQVAPQFRESDVPAETVAAAVGLQAEDIAGVAWVSTGIFWLVAHVASPEAMSRVQADMTAIGAIPLGLATFCVGTLDGGADIHVRAFAPAAGVPEDPVTGSANGCIAAYIAKHGIMRFGAGAIAYTAQQGIEMGQPGRVYARVEGGPEAPVVHIGGYAVTALRGELLLAD